MNDAANLAVRASEARATHGVTGRDVIVGVIDTGLDWRHGDFRKPDGMTRVRTMWDISDAGGTGPGNLGRVYPEAELNAALQSGGGVELKDTDSHGTHVTGIAAGNGLGAGAGGASGIFAGIAPEAELVIVKATRAGVNTFRSDRVFIILFGTGLRGRSDLSRVQVTLGGAPLTPLFAGAQGGFAGLDQINVELPSSLAGRGQLDLPLS